MVAGSRRLDAPDSQFSQHDEHLSNSNYSCGKCVTERRGHFPRCYVDKANISLAVNCDTVVLFVAFCRRGENIFDKV